MESNMMAESNSSGDAVTSFEQSVSETAWSLVKEESQADTEAEMEAISGGEKEIRYDYDIYNTFSDKQKQVDEKEEISSYTRVTLSDFSDEALDLFSSIDLNGNGFLSTSELAESVEQRF